MSVLIMSKQYQIRPSSLIDIDDSYTAYCFDEACSYIISKMNNDEQPMFKKSYKSFSEMYSQYPSTMKLKRGRKHGS